MGLLGLARAHQDEFEAEGGLVTQDALARAKRSLKIAENGGPDHPNVATSLNQLVLVQRHVTHSGASRCETSALSSIAHRRSQRSQAVVRADSEDRAVDLDDQSEELAEDLTCDGQ